MYPDSLRNLRQYGWAYNALVYIGSNPPQMLCNIRIYHLLGIQRVNETYYYSTTLMQVITVQHWLFTWAEVIWKNETGETIVTDSTSYLYRNSATGNISSTEGMWSITIYMSKKSIQNFKCWPKHFWFFNLTSTCMKWANDIYRLDAK